MWHISWGKHPGQMAVLFYFNFPSILTIYCTFCSVSYIWRTVVEKTPWTDILFYFSIHSSNHTLMLYMLPCICDKVEENTLDRWPSYLNKLFCFIIFFIITYVVPYFVLNCLYLLCYPPLVHCEGVVEWCVFPSVYVNRECVSGGVDSDSFIAHRLQCD